MYLNVMMGTTEMEMVAQKIAKFSMDILAQEVHLIIVILVILLNLTELHLNKLVRSENQQALF